MVVLTRDYFYCFKAVCRAGIIEEALDESTERLGV
jgi:hypothetical protein